MTTTVAPGLLSIGEVAERTGIPASAIRYYEIIGLISPGRDPSGRRTFDERALHRLSAIRLAQRVGFTLDDVRELFETDDGGGAWRPRVERQLAGVRASIDEARTMELLLLDALECGCEALDACPLIEPPEPDRGA